MLSRTIQWLLNTDFGELERSYSLIWTKVKLRNTLELIEAVKKRLKNYK